MAQARQDNNGVQTLLGTSAADGETPVVILADPSSHGIAFMDGITGTDLSDDIASRDNNGIPVLMCVSEDDGETPVAIYASAGQALRVDST